MLFKDVLGHGAVIRALVTAHARDKVHHAYLFAGPAGVGKRALAFGFASLLNCTGEAPRGAGGERTDGCGTCRSCRTIARTERGEGAGHPDLSLVEPLPESKRRVIKIEQVRELIRRVPFPPIEAAFRVVILDPADGLGEEAANALLKTLEEPSSRTRFLLLSSRPDAVLTTIVSRCQRMAFGRLSDDEVRRGLVERLGATPEAAEAAVGLAGGSLGLGRALMDDPVLGQRDDLVRAVLAATTSDVRAAFALGARLADLKGSLGTGLDLLVRLYRDLLVLRVGAAPQVELSSPHLADEMRPVAARYGTGSLLRRLELIEETRRGVLHRNLSARLALERLAVALTAPPGRDGARVHVPEAQRR